jgi:hypothetical protein
VFTPASSLALGKDGIQSVKGNPRQFRCSDDVVSWQ